jgi:hypothetical protein
MGAMSDREQQWYGTVGTSAHGQVHHDEIVDLTVPEGEGLLGPRARRWTESLLDVARFELARADDKANTMFRFYGVVAALSIGLLSGHGWSPTRLEAVPQAIFWTGCCLLLASGVYLGRTLYPRDIRNYPANRLLYFGHVVDFDTVNGLATALRTVEHDEEHRLVEQLLGVSRLVHRKYQLMRFALIALGSGTACCIIATLMNAVLRRV